jgi:6,7-dimethyl-8-ribityllumazine synthase
MITGKEIFIPSQHSKKGKYAIVSTSWNSEIVEEMLERAIKFLIDNGVKPKNISQVKVPGVFELPVMANKLASKKIDAVITLGCVIKGDTPHFDFISSSCAHGLMQVSLNKELPVIFGVLTTNNIKQAKDRAHWKKGNKGAEAAETAMEMVEKFKSS